jgi:hypothetical protein
MIQRIVTALAGLAFVVLTFIFASLLVAIALAAGLIAWTWIWWRGRGRVRKNQPTVVEGEYRIIDQR